MMRSLSERGSGALGTADAIVCPTGRIEPRRRALATRQAIVMPPGPQTV